MNLPGSCSRFAVSFTIALLCLLTAPAAIQAEPVSRNEALRIADAFARHSWKATARNVLHGLDPARIEVHTPDRSAASTVADDTGLWKVGAGNVGMPYKWGGFDSLESFARGIRAGKAAGDLYSAEKRRKGGAAVSAQAVGIDCSGFVSRCWKLSQKYATSTLPGICTPLRSVAELKPADIMNQPGGHVLLFARWLDDSKTRALFYEAEPFSKVVASEQDVPALAASGYRPLRFRGIRDD